MRKSLQHSTGALRFTLTNDYLFHIVFQENIEILRSLLCCLLELRSEQILSIVLENPIDPHDHVDDKEVILDLIITLNNQQKINIEMQVINGNDWPERSLTYLCRSFDKLLLNVLDLNQIHLATTDDIQCGLQKWAKLFKATTWEEIKMLAANDTTFKNVASTMHRALADEEVRLKCEARERYERDRISLYSSGHREGLKEGRKEGHKEGRNSVIQKLLEKGMSTADIASLLDMTPAELEGMITK